MREDPSPTQRSPSVKALPFGHKSGASVLPVSSLLDRAAMRLPLSRPAGVRSANTLLASAAAHVLTRMCTHARLRFEGLQSIASFARLCWHTCTCKPWKDRTPNPSPGWQAWLKALCVFIVHAKKKPLKGWEETGRRRALDREAGRAASCLVPPLHATASTFGCRRHPNQAGCGKGREPGQQKKEEEEEEEEQGERGHYCARRRCNREREKRCARLSL